MHSPPPDTDEISTLIRLAYDRLPEPDAERLTAIEARLVEQLKRPRRRVGIHWGWLLLLAGGAAATTWWSGELWLQTKEQLIQESVSLQPESAADKATGQADVIKEDTKNAPDDEQRTPLIYRREVY